MYNVKFFAHGIMTAPCVHRFKSVANAKAYVKQVEAVCIEKKLNYYVKCYTDKKTYIEKNVEF
jgi:hypothetical protein